MLSDKLALNMNGPGTTQRSVRFGVFEANFSSQELRKHGTRVRLRGQAFALLQMLVEKDGAIVSREEMKARLWPADTFVDFENGLNAAIKKLRAVLGDSPENPRYIETVPKTGYRFIAPVREPATAPASPAEIVKDVAREVAATAMPAAPAAVSKQWQFAIVSAGVLAVVALWIASRPVAVPRLDRGVALTNTARVDGFGRIQTDGARLFFLERHGPRWTLMQMPAAGGAAQPFVQPFPNTKLLAISRDASEMLVAPFTQRGEPLAIWIMATVGGAPRKLTDAIALDAAFTADGKEITYSTSEGIYRIGKDGLNQRLWIKLKGADDALDWSPDGARLRFRRSDQQHAATSIWEVRADGSGLHELLPGWEKVPSQCCGRWTADGRYYLFTTLDERGRRVVWALRDGSRLFGPSNSPVPLAAGPVPMDEPLPSADGKHLYALGDATNHENVIYEPGEGGTRALLSGVGANWPTIAADGKWMVYTQGQSLWQSDLDGGDKKELAPATLHPILSAIRPDGKLVAFCGTVSGDPLQRIYVVPSAGGTPTTLVSEPHSLHAPVWSPDGSELVYSVGSENGDAAGLYRYNTKTGSKTKIPGSEPFWKSKWSPDGRYLASVSEDQKRVGIYEVSSQQWKDIVRGDSIGPVGWSSDSKSIYYQDLMETDQPVHRMRIADGKLERIDACAAELAGGVQRCGFEGITPDGGLLLRLSRGDREVYALDLVLP